MTDYRQQQESFDVLAREYDEMKHKPAFTNWLKSLDANTRRLLESMPNYTEESKYEFHSERRRRR